MACHLFGIETLPEPVLTYCLYKKNAVKFESECQMWTRNKMHLKYLIFHIRIKDFYNFRGLKHLFYPGRGRRMCFWLTPPELLLLLTHPMACLSHLANVMAVPSSPPSAAYMCQLTGSALVQVMAWCLFGAKPLPELMLAYFQLDTWEQVSVKFQSEFYHFQSEFYHFHSRKCIWKCRLPKWWPFCRGGDEVMTRSPTGMLLT